MAHVLFRPILFSLVIEFSCNSGMQPSCVSMSKEENRKEYVDRKVQIHHYHHVTIKKKKQTHVLAVVSSEKDSTDYIHQEYSSS